MKFFLIAVILIFIAGIPEAAKANSYDSQFYADLKAIVVDVFATKHTDGTIEFMLDRDFPIKNNEVLNLTITAIKNEIKTKNEISIQTPQDAGGGYDYGDNKSKDKIYIRVDMRYWDSSDFSPSLDRDVIVISVKTKRNIVEYDMTGGEKALKAREKHLEPLLISVPDAEKDLGPHLQHGLEKFFEERFKYLNCANGGSCPSTY